MENANAVFEYDYVTYSLINVILDYRMIAPAVRSRPLFSAYSVSGESEQPSDWSSPISTETMAETCVICKDNTEDRAQTNGLTCYSWI